MTSADRFTLRWMPLVILLLSGCTAQPEQTVPFTLKTPPPLPLTPIATAYVPTQDVPFDGHVEALLWRPHTTQIIMTRGNDILLWDVASQTNQATFSGHTNSVLALAIDPTGTLMASGSQDSTVRLWDVPTATMVHTFTPTNRFVHEVQISPDGQTLAVDDTNGSVTLWDIATRSLRADLDNDDYHRIGHGLAFRPDSQVLAVASDAIELWDVTTGTLRTTWPATDVGHVTLAWSPDGRTLAAGTRTEGAVELWDTETGTIRRTVRGHAESPDWGVWTTDLAWNPDSTRLATASVTIFASEIFSKYPLDGSNVHIWDTQHGRLLLSFPHPHPGNNVTSPIHGPLAWSPDGTHLVTTDYPNIVVWRMP